MLKKYLYAYVNLFIVEFGMGIISPKINKNIINLK